MRGVDAGSGDWGKMGSVLPGSLAFTMNTAGGRGRGCFGAHTVRGGMSRGTVEL